MTKLKPNQFHLPSGALITEHPILFQTEMVKAILENRKTQTRRTRGLEAINVDAEFWNRIGDPRKNKVRFWDSTKEINPNPLSISFGFKDPIDCIEYVKSVYGKPGDLLWVKETWARLLPLWKDYANEFAMEATKGLRLPYHDGDVYYYKAGFNSKFHHRWKPSIHMPKTASRIWAMVEDIRVERVQDISEEDAEAEGIEEISNKFGYSFKIYRDYKNFMPDGYQSRRYSFQSLWRSINGEESWNSNPWVWVIKYRVLSKTGRPSIKEIEKAYSEIKKEVNHV